MGDLTTGLGVPARRYQLGSTRLLCYDGEVREEKVCDVTDAKFSEQKIESDSAAPGPGKTCISSSSSSTYKSATVMEGCS